MIRYEQFRQLCPRAQDMVASGVVGAIKTHGPECGIITRLRLCHFLAQTCHETSGYQLLTENLNYSAEGLANTWPGRFSAGKTAAGRHIPNPKAEALHRNPQAIAEAVYGGRMGNDQPGDGWDYRGRGAGQLTGKANYAEFGPLVGRDLVTFPHEAADPWLSTHIALLFFERRGVGLYADRDDLLAATKAWNGGLIGLKERGEWLQRAKAIFINGE